MNVTDAIDDLKKNGLSIFLSAKVSDLPSDIYPFSDKQKKKTLCLVGNGGKLFWSKIHDNNQTNPVDTFSINLMNQFSERCLQGDMEILFPDDNLLLPLQKLSRYFNFSHQSPLGIDISADYGLWFAFRGVFLTNAEVPMINLKAGESPCEKCTDKPCLSDSDIFNARMKCPVKNEHQYSQEQRYYHQSIVAMLKKPC